ncbi:MAG TPA: heparan-alpha-glucosaminide N-acetyltransferase domain-containing protein [Bryobacteraceae bacterium]|nr:heparan-alpha-glucosaminide N-acetyltransferase domain-containing protein [Bryobacteraceae bacterium]
MAPVKSSSSRFAFIDWTRGLAAVIMLNGHVFHSFTQPEHRGGSAFVLSQFIGGMPPAFFLFLLGVTLAFLMESRERQAVPFGGRVVAALGRSGYLLGIAVLFRVQLYVVGLPGTSWQDLFRVDILNAMGFAVLAFSFLAVLTTASRVRVGAVAGLVVAFGAPLVSMLDLRWVPSFLRAYIVPDLQAFGFFPWAAFVAFGISAGSILRLTRRDQLDRVMRWAALLGLVLILGARYCADIPYSLYPKSEFWLNGPWLIFIKLGVVLLTLTAAYVWTQHGGNAGWSWVRQFGTTSLLVYWVHTELVYGRWLYFWKESLTPAQTAFASLGVILLMLGLSALKTNWKSVRLGLARLGLGYPVPEPHRVPGD